MAIFQRLRNAAYGFFADPDEVEEESIGEFWVVDGEDEETGAPALLVYASLGDKRFMFVENRFAAIGLGDQDDVKSWALEFAPPYEGAIPFDVEVEQ
jgi:hypothetical protein